MINVKVITKQDNYIGYRVEGHAEYDEYGQDIVCAAVSTISQAILLGLHTLNISIGKGTGDGILEVNAYAKDKENQDKVNLLINTLYMTIRDISSQYPLNVQIKMEAYDG